MNLLPVVWSLEGPVPTEAVDPLYLVQLKSSFVAWVQPHVLLSKLQLNVLGTAEMVFVYISSSRFSSIAAAVVVPVVGVVVNVALTNNAKLKVLSRTTFTFNIIRAFRKRDNMK